MHSSIHSRRRIIWRSPDVGGHGGGCAEAFLNSNLHSPERRLIELRIEHADLDAWIDRLATETPGDELMLRRLKKRRLVLRDHMARLELTLDPKEPA